RNLLPESVQARQVAGADPVRAVVEQLARSADLVGGGPDRSEVMPGATGRKRCQRRGCVLCAPGVERAEQAAEIGPGAPAPGTDAVDELGHEHDPARVFGD